MDEVLEREGLPLVGEEVPVELKREVAQEGADIVAPGPGGWVLDGRNRDGALTLEGAVERKERIEAFEDVFEELRAPDEFAGFRIPGIGQPVANCAEWLPASNCPRCGYVGAVRGTCRNAECPRCSTRWRFNRVESILERIISFKSHFRDGVRVLHCVTSFEEDLELQELFERSRELARSKGLWGAVELLHPYRLERAREASECPVYEDEDGVGRPDCRECPASGGCAYSELKRRAGELLEEWSGGEFGLWRALQKLIQEGEAELEEFAYYSPHVHHVGVSKWTEEAEEGDLGVWKVVGELEEPEDVLKCAMYLLSHLGLEVPDEGKRAPSIRWSGSLASSKWDLSRASPGVQELTRRKVDMLLSRREEQEAGDVDGQVRDGCECPSCGRRDMVPIWRVDRSELSEEARRVLEVAERVRAGEFIVPSRVSSEAELNEWLREEAGLSD